MRNLIFLSTATLCLVCFGLSPARVAAQTPTSSYSETELQKWVDDYLAWRDWMDHHHNFVVYRVWGGIGQRKKMPEAPAWLEDECRDLVSASGGLLGNACELFKESREDYSTMMERAQMRRVQAQNEKPKSSIFQKRLHIDALWTATYTGASTYGLLGAHVTFLDIARLQVFIPPGFMVFLVPDGNHHRVAPSATMGVSVRLFNFHFPGEPKKATLHFNVAKAWAYGLSSPPIDVAGLSVSFKK